jgi:hypothetical protein
MVGYEYNERVELTTKGAPKNTKFGVSTIRNLRDLRALLVKIVFSSLAAAIPR